MDIETYDKKIDLAFYGSGGGIVWEYYQEAIRGTETLKDVVDRIEHDLGLYMLDDWHPDIVVIDNGNCSDEDRVAFINSYMRDKCCNPELCGTVAGILFRNGEREMVLEFLEIDDLDEPRYWDS